MPRSPLARAPAVPATVPSTSCGTEDIVVSELHHRSPNVERTVDWLACPSTAGPPSGTLGRRGTKPDGAVDGDGPARDGTAGPRLPGMGQWPGCPLRRLAAVVVADLRRPDGSRAGRAGPQRAALGRPGDHRFHRAGRRGLLGARHVAGAAATGLRAHG